MKSGSYLGVYLFSILTFTSSSWAQTNTNSTALPPTVEIKNNNPTNPVIRTSSTNWLPRHEGFVAQAKKGGIDLLFLGDSITDNWRTKGSNVWSKIYASRNAGNFGIGGDRLQHVLWRVQNGELDGLHPKAIVLLIGTNNSQNDSPTDIATAIKLIIGEIKARCAGTKVLLLAIFPRGPRTNSDKTPDDGIKRMQTIHEANELIAKLDDGQMVKFMDINAKFLNADGKIPNDIMPDQLHPNEKGYQIWAEAIEPTLTEMLK